MLAILLVFIFHLNFPLKNFDRYGIPKVHKLYELRTILSSRLEDLIFDEYFCLFRGEFLTAGLTVKAGFAIKTHFFAMTFWAAYFLIFCLKHFLIRSTSYTEKFIY